MGLLTNRELLISEKFYTIDEMNNLLITLVFTTKTVIFAVNNERLNVDKP